RSYNKLLEYKVVELNFREASQLEAKLNYLANDKWEVIQIIMRRIGSNSSHIYIILKREKK
ncbi:MAG: DUF4177 domain-containing protein, partial [Promethearchaeota archaeon]